MTAPAALGEAVEAALGETLGGSVPIGGGSINDAWRFELSGAGSVLVKTRDDASPAEFEAEAAGMRWLAEAGAPVPRVLATSKVPALIALEWIEPGSLTERGAEGLGVELAAMHRAGARAFGALPPGSPDSVLRIGSVELGLVETASWCDLYAQQMLSPLARQAHQAESLSPGDAASIEALCERLEELAGPPEPAARLHGDLWSGNVLADARGGAWLIDPAAYGGHREVDLAMLRLFGAPSERLLAAYGDAYPLSPGHEDRVELWQLLPLLVHAVLFAGSYGSAAGRAARRYL